MIRYVLIALVVLDYLWQIFGVYLSSKQMKKPLPACVQGIYDDEQYARWVAYTHEKRRFSLITGGLSAVLVVVVLALNLLAWIHGLVGVGGRGRHHGGGPLPRFLGGGYHPQLRVHVPH